VWVANQTSNSVTELDDSTGRLVEVIRGSSYGFNEPGAMAVTGSRLWVPNTTGDSVTELDDSTGALLKVFGGSRYDFQGPFAVARDGAPTSTPAAMAAGVTVIEYLTNLDQIGVARCRCVALPLRIEGADGSPVRAIALVD